MKDYLKTVGMQGNEGPIESLFAQLREDSVNDNK